MPPADLDVAIILPCLNEANTLESCIARARQALVHHGLRGEIVVGDNGSTDGSQQIALRAGARVVDVATRGYGAALMGAMSSATAPLLVMGDSDGSYDWSEIMPYVDQLRAGHDVVVGNRFLGRIHPGAMPPLNRYLGNPALSFIGRLLFRAPIGDFHCGMRGLTREAFARMQLQTTGMEFASEMIVKATLLGMRIGEVPATLSPDGRGRPPHLRPWRDGWRHLRFMLLYSPAWLFLYPGLALMVSGGVIGGWLLPHARSVGGVEFDVHTLLYAAAAVLVGFQAVGFAAFTYVFTTAEGLLPKEARVDRLLDRFNLEWGLLVGAVLIAAGLGGSVWAVWSWRQADFGALDPSDMLRRIIPAMLALVLGCETVFSSFFLSALRMGRR